jgi:hypothetical protein
MNSIPIFLRSGVRAENRYTLLIPLYGIFEQSIGSREENASIYSFV